MAPHRKPGPAWVRRLCTAFGAWLLLSGAALAQSCTFTITNANFGAVPVASGGTVDTTATINVGCSYYTVTNFCVGIDTGSGGYNGSSRVMTGPSSTLRYNLYQDAARTIPWGSRTTPSIGTIPYRTTSGAQTWSATATVYGRVQGAQSTALIGSYSSTFSGTQAEAYFLTSGTDCTTSPSSSSQYATFSVLASVASDCGVTATPLDFGTSNGLSSAAVNGFATLSVTCTNTTPYTVGLDNGLNGTGPAARKMKNGANLITYGLYLDSARSQPWSTVAGSMATGTGSGVAQSIPVYGRVAAGQTPPPGLYADTVAIIVTF